MFGKKKVSTPADARSEWLRSLAGKEFRTYAQSFPEGGADAFTVSVKDNMVRVRIDVFEDLTAMAGYKPVDKDALFGD